jgi:hypothetical protein
LELTKAFWIWPGGWRRRVRNSYAQFRRDFDLRSVPQRAPFFVSADQSYMLFANGRYVCRGPARGYQVSWPYDEADLAPYLRKGHNWIAIRAYNAGISNYQYLHQSIAGLICGGTFGRVRVCSGPGWLMRDDPAHRQDTARTSWQTNFQENIDLRRDDQAWVYRAAPPRAEHDGWKLSTAGRCFGHMPWHTMEPRGVPMLTNDVVPYGKLISSSSGPCATDWAAWTDIGHGLVAELRGATWAPCPVSPRQGTGLRADRRDGCFYLTLPACAPGQYVARVLDLEEPCVGTLLVHASAPSGGTVDFYFTEVVQDGSHPLFTQPGQGSNAAMALRLTLPKGPSRYEAHQIIGHRYLVVVARALAKPVELDLALRQTIYPLEVRGRFATSDPVLNDIHRICVRTQRVCMLDAYVDTPWREQTQWWGDARVQARNTFHLANDPRLLARGIRSLAHQETPNGLTFGHAPTTAWHCVLPDFSMTWALTIWDYYWQTGDLTLFIEQWPRIERLLTYFRTEGRGELGLLRYDKRYWLFLDWCDIFKDGYPTLLNLWHLLMLARLAQLAQYARMPHAHAMLAAWHRLQRRLVDDLLWDERAGLFRDGLQFNGRPVVQHSIHCQTLAILAGLRPRHHGPMIQHCLLPYLQGQPVHGAQPSSYWVTYVYEAMIAAGFGGQVVGHIRRHWEKMIPYGGTWETFDMEWGALSVTHAWAAHPIHHLVATLGGLRQTDAAWRAVRFEPVLDVAGLDGAESTIPTPHGLIGSWWRRAKSGVRVGLKLPPRVKALVVLPGRVPMNIHDSGAWTVG